MLVFVPVDVLTGVFVAVRVAVNVGVPVAVAVRVLRAVGVAVFVRVGVFVRVAVTVNDGSGSGVSVGVATAQARVDGQAQTAKSARTGRIFFLKLIFDIQNTPLKGCKVVLSMIAKRPTDSRRPLRTP